MSCPSLPTTLFNRLVWFRALRSVILQREGKLDRDLLFKAHSERLQTSMPEARFELADYSTQMAASYHSAIARLFNRLKEAVCDSCASIITIIRKQNRLDA
jgi:hypothetical protein